MVQVDTNQAEGLERWHWHDVDLSLLLEQYTGSRVIHRYKHREQQILTLGKHNQAALQGVQLQLLSKVVSDFSQQLCNLYVGSATDAKVDLDSQNMKHSQFENSKRSLRRDEMGREVLHDVFALKNVVEDEFSSPHATGTSLHCPPQASMWLIARMRFDIKPPL